MQYFFRTFVLSDDPAKNKKIFTIINKILLFLILYRQKLRFAITFYICGYLPLLFVPSLFSFLLPALITFFSFPEQGRPGRRRILLARPNKFIFWGFLPQGGRRMWFSWYRKNKV